MVLEEYFKGILDAGGALESSVCLYMCRFNSVIQKNERVLSRYRIYGTLNHYLATTNFITDGQMYNSSQKLVELVKICHGHSNKIFHFISPPPPPTNKSKKKIKATVYISNKILHIAFTNSHKSPGSVIVFIQYKTQYPNNTMGQSTNLDKDLKAWFGGGGVISVAQNYPSIFFFLFCK